MIETQGAEKIVTMTCCNSRYATVVETLGHECPADDTELFASILKLEEKAADTKWTVRATQSGLISSAYQGAYATDRAAENGAKMADSLQDRQRELFAAIDALTPAQREAYGRYRQA